MGSSADRRSTSSAAEMSSSVAPAGTSTPSVAVTLALRVRRATRRTDNTWTSSAGRQAGEQQQRQRWQVGGAGDSGGKHHSTIWASQPHTKAFKLARRCALTDCDIECRCGVSADEASQDGLRGGIHARLQRQPKRQKQRRVQDRLVAGGCTCTGGCQVATARADRPPKYMIPHSATTQPCSPPRSHPQPAHLHYDVLWIQPRQDDVEADHHGIPAGTARWTNPQCERQVADGPRGNRRTGEWAASTCSNCREHWLAVKCRQLQPGRQRTWGLGRCRG
jgi:hypothetical protein